MPGPARKRWLTPPRWLGRLTGYFDRRVDRLAGSPEKSLAVTERWLSRAERRWGTDSPKTVNLMEAVAAKRDRAGDHEGALGLRRQVLATRTEHLGPDNRLTLQAEFSLSGTLVQLDRTDDARPLAEHALEGFVVELGPDDPSSLAALERCARIQLVQGETLEGMLKYRSVITGFEGRDDQRRAMVAATNMGRILVAQGRYDEALGVFREVVDTRSRLLGPTDPATLASLRDLALTLARMGRLPESLVVARSLVDAVTELHGADDPSAEDARTLLKRIEDSLPPG
jgi:hypothetical protein